jgi:hypothetical protein
MKAILMVAALGAVLMPPAVAQQVPQMQTRQGWGSGVQVYASDYYEPVHVEPQMIGCNSSGGLTWIAIGTASVEHLPLHGQQSSITFSSQGTNLDHVQVSILWAQARQVTIDPIVRQSNVDIITVHFDGTMNLEGTIKYEPQMVSYILLMTDKSNGCKITP